MHFKWLKRNIESIYYWELAISKQILIWRSHNILARTISKFYVLIKINWMNFHNCASLSSASSLSALSIWSIGVEHLRMECKIVLFLKLTINIGNSNLWMKIPNLHLLSAICSYRGIFFDDIDSHSCQNSLSFAMKDPFKYTSNNVCGLFLLVQDSLIKLSDSNSCTESLSSAINAVFNWSWIVISTPVFKLISLILMRVANDECWVLRAGYAIYSWPLGKSWLDVIYLWSRLQTKSP